MVDVGKNRRSLEDSEEEQEEETPDMQQVSRH
jgi:hypothetical protein